MIEKRLDNVANLNKNKSHSEKHTSYSYQSSHIFASNCSGVLSTPVEIKNISIKDRDGN